MSRLANILGWIGAFLIMGSYGLVSFGVLEARDISYQLMNMFGAFGIVISSYKNKDMQPVVINVFWIMIALFAIINLI